MLGLVRRVLDDGVVTEEEARALSAFVRARPAMATRWPGDVLALRLGRIFEDRRVDPEEREELAQLLRRILEGEAGMAPPEVPLPLDDPPPVVSFRDRTFVFVGPLAAGSRGDAHRTVVKLGGRYATEVTGATDYVVVGGFTGGDWTRSAAAGEIRRAAELREAGAGVAIVAEEEFTRALPRDLSQGPNRRA